MRRIGKLGIIAFVGVVLGVAGCGGGGGRNPGAPVALTPENSATIAVDVSWPTGGDGSRVIMSTAQSIKVFVTGPDIGTPITGTLNAPNTTLTLTVLAGSDRQVNAQGFDAPDAGGTQIQKASAPATVPLAAAGQSYSVTLYMVDMFDPADDDPTGATSIATDGMPSPLHVIEGADGTWRDQRDFFRFAAVASEEYTIATGDVIGTAAGGRYVLSVYDSDGSSLLAQSASFGIGPGGMLWTAAGGGDRFVAVEGTVAPDIRMEYTVSISVPVPISDVEDPLRVTKTTLRADGSDWITISAFVTQADGSPAPPDIPILFRIIQGRAQLNANGMQAEARTAEGMAKVTLTAVDETSPPIIVRATPSRGTAGSTPEIYVSSMAAPGPTFDVEDPLAVSKRSIKADGSDSATITAFVWEPDGRPVRDDVPILFRVLQGRGQLNANGMQAEARTAEGMAKVVLTTLDPTSPDIEVAAIPPNGSWETSSRAPLISVTP